jgi:epoxyqueuosine reductase
VVISEIREYITELCSTHELNRLPAEFGGGRFYGAPVVGVARGSDPIFQKFKEVVAPEHLTPAEMWLASGLPDAPGLAERLRVLSIVFPYVEWIRQEGTKAKDGLPPEIYCVARNFADAFIDAMLEATERLFRGRGFRAASGVRSGAFGVTIRKEPYGAYSNWSERHVAFAAGLGTFSLHEGLITAVGCNVRLGSVITDAPLEVTPRHSDEPRSNCLHYAKGACGACIKRCPAGAITEAGHDKRKCQAYGRQVSDVMHSRPFYALLKTERRRINGEHRTTVNVGCGLCQFGVPCMDTNPVKRRRRRPQ